MCTSGYEEETIALFSRLVHEGDVCVDVGANRGYLALIMARLVGPAGLVHCFEPGRRALGDLENNIRLNLERTSLLAKMLIHPIAVSDRPGNLLLFSSRTDMSEDSTTSFFSSPGVQVKTERLDDVLNGLFPIRLVKIDAEGSELAVLRGMKETIRNNPDLYILIEWNRGYTTSALWTILAEGFDIFRVIDRDAGPTLLRVSSPSELGGANLVCLGKSASPAARESLLRLLRQDHPTTKPSFLKTGFEMLDRAASRILGPRVG